MNTIFYLIVAILILSFIFERILDALNIKYLKPELPAVLKGRYDEEKYSRSQVYLKEKNRFGFLSSSFSFIIILLFLFFGGFGWLNNIVLGITVSAVLQALIFFGIIGFAFDILSIPFELYGIFVIVYSWKISDLLFVFYGFNDF